MERIDEVFDVLVSQLLNTDSYVYLAAVAGLTALADCYAEVRLRCTSWPGVRSDIPRPSRLSDTPTLWWF